MITPSLQARITSETIDFLNRFGGWWDSKTTIHSANYENSAEGRTRNDVLVLANQWATMEDGVRDFWLLSKNG